MQSRYGDGALAGGVLRAYGVYVKTTVGLLMMLLSVAAHGQLMKCVSQDGKIEYASQCPPGTKQEATRIRSTPPAASPSATATQKSLAEQEAEFRKRRAEKDEAEAKDAKKMAETAQRSRACDDARAYLKSLREGQRVVRVDPKTGERSYLEDAQYATEIAAAQRSVDTNCK